MALHEICIQWNLALWTPHLCGRDALVDTFLRSCSWCPHVQCEGLAIYPTIICNIIFHWFRNVESIPTFFSDRFPIGRFSKWSPNNLCCSKWRSCVCGFFCPTRLKLCRFKANPLISSSALLDTRGFGLNPRSLSLVILIHNLVYGPVYHITIRLIFGLPFFDRS